MFRYLFKRDTIFATILVFIVMGLLALIPLNTHVLDPIKMSLQDFDYNDLTYSRLKKNADTEVDTNMVIVNIGTLERKDIAKLIQKLNSYQPKVIGVDVLFNDPKDQEQDSLLQQLTTTGSNIVFAYELQTSGEAIHPKGFLYNNPQRKGYANFVGERGGVIRHFAPVVKDGNNTYLSFAAAITSVSDEQQFQQLMKRDHATEIIHYTRTPDKFMVVEGEEILSGNETMMMRGKIVLLGFVAPGENSIEDKHFTPRNRQSIGKSLPDMEGVFVHANIIQMILKNNYIAKTPAWIIWTIAVILGWLHMSLFLKYFVEHHIWFHLVAKLAQLISAIVFVYIGLLLYYKGDLKINLTPTLVAIILAVDVLYFYEAFCNWLHKKTGYQSVFSSAKHH